MDSRLAGQWYKSEMGETINIFDEDPLRMKISFSSSGYYNVEPNCVYEKDGYFCFEINDETYRMVYHVRYDEGFLKGYYTQHGKQTQVLYERISEIPEDGMFEHSPVEPTVPGTDMTRIDILKKYAAYDSGEPSNCCSVEYRLFEPAPEILHKYDYGKYTGAAGDALAFSMLDFVCDHFGHDGYSGMPQGRRVQDIITYCEGNNGKINCRGLAILLAALLRFNGIKASHITCKPCEEPFDDCHVVTDCHLPSGKRIMFDPTYRLYLTDAGGEFIPPRRLRTTLINGEDYLPGAGASYNGGAFDLDYHRRYMTKNTFRFSRGTLCADGHDDRAERRIELVPAGYPTDKFSDRDKSEFVFSEAEFWD
jgi:hypothetical protein